MNNSEKNNPERPASSDPNQIPGQHITAEEERNYTYSISEEDRKKSFEIEDVRWTRANQLADWGKLGIMILIYIAWSLIVYILEPGLR